MKKLFGKTTALLLVFVLAAANVAIVGAADDVLELEYVPIRVAFERLGASVEWDADERSITVAWQGNTAVLFVDNQNLYVNDEAETLHFNVFIDDGASFIHRDDHNRMLAALLGLSENSQLGQTIVDANHLVPNFLEDFAIPGMAIAIVDVQNDFTWTQGFGLADTAQGIAVDADTVFGIGSVSKTFVAIAVMQLVENGIIDLDVPIVEYLPDFSILPSPTGGDYRNITARMLLTHTSGIFTQVDLTEDLFRYHYLSLEAHNPHFFNSFLEILAQYSMEYPEGETFSYSNKAYVLLGVLVAAMTGDDGFFDGFVRYVDENIFEPTNMTRTSFVLDDALIPYLARPYVDTSEPEEYIFSNGLPASSMVSTANDMAHFMHLLLADDGALLAPGAIRQMMQPHDFNFADIGMEVGLGFAIIPSEAGFYATGHDGQRLHYEAFMFFDIESGVGVFVATNAFAGSINRVAFFVGMTLLENAVAEKN